MIVKGNTELNNWVEITSKEKRVIYSVELDLEAGQEIAISGQIEVTNAYQYNIGVGHYYVRSSTQRGVTGELLAPATMANVTPAEHHKVLQATHFDKVEQAGKYYYNLVLYAAANQASVGHKLYVELGYGQIVGKV